jgi:ABC-type lipoprotein release transport system permease subunit
MNTLWIAIRERTREIGTLRAIGMQRRKVLWLFVLEAALLGLAGTGAGAAAATLLALGLNAAHLAVPEAVQMFLMQRDLHLALAAGPILGAVALLTGVTTLFALFPALRAARLAPVTAMHHIG